MRAFFRGVLCATAAAAVVTLGAHYTSGVEDPKRLYDIFTDVLGGGLFGIYWFWLSG